MKGATIYRNGWVSPEALPGGRKTPARSYLQRSRERQLIPKSSYAVDFAGEQDRYSNVDILAEGLIGELQRFYDFKNGATVVDFLRDKSNCSLSVVLLSAQDAIREYFGHGTRPALKVATDPEARDDQQLFIVIRTKLRPKAARTILAELDKEWWQSIFPATEGKVTVSLEYV